MLIIPEHLQVSEVQLVYRTTVKPSERIAILSSKDCFSLLNSIWDKGTVDLRETFYVLLLNRANRALGVYELSNGGVSGTVADPKLIFVAAIKSAASGIILAHNHPSGNLRPSQNDIEFTKRIKEAGKLLEVQLLDHMIISSEHYFSFADEGLI